MSESHEVSARVDYFSIGDKGSLGESYKKNGGAGYFMSRLLHNLPLACEELIELYGGKFLEVPELVEPVEKNEHDDRWSLHFHYKEFVFLLVFHRNYWHYMIRVKANVEEGLWKKVEKNFPATRRIELRRRM